jgi:hypothetical protein
MFKYTIVRSRRKTLCIVVAQDNKVTVRAPMRCAAASIEKFVAEKSAWVERILAKNEGRNSRNEEVISYQKIYVGGVVVPLQFTSFNAMDSGGVYAKSIKDLKKIYVENLGDVFLERVKTFSRTIGVQAKSVTFKNYKSRWGCCDRADNVCFHFGLLMLPERLQDYVIVHELCHIKQHNHSAAFWAEVAKYFSDYKKARKELSDYSFVTRLY